MRKLSQIQAILACTCVLIILLSLESRAQGSAGTEALLEPRALIDLPTAGMLRGRTLALDMNFFQAGSVLASFSVGIVDRFLIGVSYGGADIIGSGTTSWNRRPGFTAKFRIIDEMVLFPAIALGFESQGKELFIDSLDRYAVKPLGLYTVGSKNYQLFGYLAVHGGVNYSLEQGDGNKNINFFMGVEKSVGPFATAVFEYNFNNNDEFRNSQGNSGGYLNAGIRISVGNGFTLGFNFKDIVKNQESYSVSNRTMQFEYVKAF